MIDSGGKDRTYWLKNSRHQRTRSFGLGWLAPFLVAVCVALLLPASVSGPSEAVYQHVPDSGTALSAVKGDSLWSRTFGGANSDRAHDVIQCADGGLAMAGYTASFGAGGNDFWIVRTDLEGNHLWNKTYGTTRNEVAYTLVQCEDGGFLIGGYAYVSTSVGNDFWLVRIDSQGNHLWNRTFGGTLDDQGSSLVLCDDGGFAVAGSTASFGAGSYDFWLIRIDSQGNHLWNRTYGRSGADSAGSLIECSDGGLAMAGSTNSFAGQYQFWLVRTDSQGNHLWNRTYSIGSEDRAYSLVQCQDGGFAVAGQVSQATYDAWLVRTDSDGVEVWNATYGGGRTDYCWSVTLSKQGGFYTAGTLGWSGIWVQELDATGQVLWSNGYGGWGHDVAELSQLGLVAVGWTNNQEDFLLVRLSEGSSWLEVPPDQTIELGDAFEYQLEVQEALSPIEYWLNDTTYFTVGSDGIVRNATIVPIGRYGLTAYANDSYGDVISAEFAITVQDTAPPAWVQNPSDRVTEYGEPFRYDLNATDPSGLDKWWVNDTARFTIDVYGVMTNATPLPVGVYGLLVSVNDTHGYILSSSFDVEVRDTTPPTWVQNPSDRIVELGEAFRYDLNATDLSGLDNWWTNNTALFSIDSYGVLTNKAPLPEGLHGLLVYVNDTHGNVLSSGFCVEVRDTSAPVWVQNPTDLLVELGEPFRCDLNATDLSGLDKWWVNDTARFIIDAYGVITNAAPLPQGVLGLYVYVNDTHGNTLSSAFTIEVVRFVRVAVVRCYFTDYPEYAIWGHINANWRNYGTDRVIVDYTTLAVPTITLEALQSSGADVLYMGPFAVLTASELEAIMDYVEQGHGLVADTDVPWSSGELWNFLGLAGNVAPGQWAEFSQDFSILVPGHPIVQGLPDPFSNSLPYGLIPTPSGWTDSIIGGATCVAMSGTNQAVVLAFRGLVYFSHLPVYSAAGLDQEAVRLFYNAVVWSRYARPEHDILVRLEAPTYADLDGSVAINITVVNDGLSDETGIDVSLYDDGTQVFSTTIGQLQSGAKYTVTFYWAPLLSGLHNLTVRISDLAVEDSYQNNVAQSSVWALQMVSGPVAIFQDQDPQGWCPSLRNILTGLGIPFVIFSSSDMGSVDLAPYEKVIIASEQPASFMSAISLHLGWFTDYAESGGILEIHGCQSAYWVGGEMPGGITYVPVSTNTAIVVDSSHRLVTEPHTVTGDELSGWGMSALGYLEDVPRSAEIIVTDDHGRPLLIVFDHGFGSIVVTTLIVEVAFDFGLSDILENLVLYSPTKQTHDVSVLVEVPNVHQTGTPALLNVSVFNRGVMAENGISIEYLVNGTAIWSTVVSSLEAHSIVFFSHPWTPLSEGVYNITASISTVTGETATGNNAQWKLIIVGHLKYVLWDTTHSNMLPVQFSSLIDEITDNCFVVEVLQSGPIDLTLLEGYDILVIAQPTLFYSTNEADAIQDFVLAGGGLLVLGDYNSDIFNVLTNYAGISWSWVSLGMGCPYEILHPVTAGLLAFSGTDIHCKLNATSPAIGLLPFSTSGYYVIAASQIGLGKIVCISDEGVISDSEVEDNPGLGINSLSWLAEPTHEHDLWACVHCWTPLGYYEAPVKLTVLNSGTSTETDFIIKLYLDGRLVFADFVSVLNRSTLYTYEYGWTPTRRGFYNFTVVVEAVPGEIRLEDNRYTTLVLVVDDEIRIIGDDDFVSQGWPGSGTHEDPYVIEDLYIMVFWSSRSCILVQDTRAYFVIRNCTFMMYDQDVDGIGVYLLNVTNGLVVNNTFTDGLYGVYMENCSFCIITDNSFAGYVDAIRVYVSWDLEIAYNVITRNDAGIRLLSSGSSVIRNNTIIENNWGLTLDSVSDNVSLFWNNFCNVHNVEDNGLQNNFTENYYSDYTGIDGDFDGFGDTPYPIPGTAGSEDPRPLALPAEGPFIVWLTGPNDVTIQYYEALRVEIKAAGYAEVAGYWVNNTAIVVIDENGVLTNITEIAAGEYVLEVRAFDNYGHYCSAVFVLTVLDSACPEWVEEPVDQTVEVGDLFSYDLDATDFSGIHTWWLDDTSQFSISSGGLLTMNTLLPVGVYWVQVSVNDTLGNVLTETIRIEVMDTEAPTWVVVPEEVYVNYGDDATLVIHAEDLSGVDHYWVNDTARFSVDEDGFVTSTVSLSCGEIPLEVRAYDGYGHYCSASVMIVVLDVTIPTINHPADVTYTEGEEGNSITWQGSDDNPVWYEVLRDGCVIKDGLWNSSSEQITVSVDGLAPGLYSYVLLVHDAGNHEMSDSVQVTVIKATTTTTTTTTTATTTTTTPDATMMLVAISISAGSVAFAVIVLVLARRGILGRKPIAAKPAEV